MIFGVRFLSIWLRGFRLCGFNKKKGVCGGTFFMYRRATNTSAADMTITAGALAGSQTFLVGND